VHDSFVDFNENYNSPACSDMNTTSSIINSTGNNTNRLESCDRGKSILSLALVLGTVWLSSTLFQFRKSPYLDVNKRIFLSEYALPLAVVFWSFIGSYVAKDIECKVTFEFN
jgi:sodium borate transporter 11